MLEVLVGVQPSERCWNGGKPPLVSSPGPPGACMTPSREMNSSTIVFLMIEFPSTGEVADFSVTVSSNEAQHFLI